MKRFSLFFCTVLILSLLFSVCLPVGCHAETGEEEMMTVLARQLQEKLDPVFLTVADKIDAEMNGYEASGEILKDENGNDIDMTVYLALMRTNAEALRTFSTKYDPQMLVLTDLYYASFYIDTAKYRSWESAAEEIVRYMADSYYLDRIVENDLVTQYLIRAYCLVGQGDKYASFFTQEDMEEDATVTYSGIGVSVISRADGYADVVAVTRDSPAEAAGIAVGDIIIGVNGKDFAEIGYYAAIKEVRGEVGTDVTLSFRRGDETYEKTLTRALLTNYSVTYRMLEEAESGKVGYIHISEFKEGTFTQFADAVEALEAQGAEKFVFDVRNNPGGNLEVILAVLAYITPDNTGLPLIRMEYKDTKKNVAYYDVKDYITANFSGETLKKAQQEFARSENHMIQAPMVVLCNQYTASAGELFTSCLKDFGAAEVIGVKTYGKGTGQTGFGLPESDGTFSAVNISTFRYAPPVTGNYEGVGVLPDKTVELPEEVRETSFYKLTYEDDTQLQSAVAFLAGQTGGTSLPDIVPSGPGKTEGNFFTGETFFILVVVGLTVIAAAVILLLVLFARRKKTVLENADFLFTDTRPEEKEERTENDKNAPEKGNGPGNPTV